MSQLSIWKIVLFVFLLLKSNYSKYCYIYFLKKKTEIICIQLVEVFNYLNTLYFMSTSGQS